MDKKSIWVYRLFMDIYSEKDPVGVFINEMGARHKQIEGRYLRFKALFGERGGFRLCTGNSSASQGHAVTWYAEIHGGLLFAVIYGDNADSDEAAADEWRRRCVSWFERVPSAWGVAGALFQFRTKSTSRIIAEAGRVPDSVTVDEPEGSYLLTHRRGMNPGLFLDARNARSFVARYAAGKKILNLFSYTCGFSVAALKGGASQVVNIDMKRQFLEWGRDNHSLNGLDMRKARFEKLDIMKSFGRLERFGPYGMIICDPPTFQGKSFSRIKDFPRLIRRCLPMVAPGGLLVVLINDLSAPDDYVWDLIRRTDLPEAAAFYPFASIAPCIDFGPDGARGTVFERRG